MRYSADPPERTIAVTKQIQERDRVKSQQFFCVARERKGEFEEDFSVLGSTGNGAFMALRASERGVSAWIGQS